MQSRLFARSLFVRLLCVLLSLLLTLALPVQAVESITYLHNDAAGSPVAATDAAGNVIWRESYRAYGERTRNETASRANRQFFHGKAFDADSGLAYFGARYYDPVVGRFMAMDPQGFDEANLHSFNRYAYGNNNPYRYTDRDGRFPILIPLIGLFAGGGLVVAANQPSKPYGSGGSIENSVPGFGTSMLTKLKNLVFNEDAKGQGAGSGDAKPSESKPASGAPRPEGIPENWVEVPSRDGKGTKWVDPSNPKGGDYVRERGDGTLTQVKNGRALDSDGNAASGLSSPEAHFPRDQWKFRP